MEAADAGCTFRRRVDELIRLALDEDLPGRDVTSEAVIREGAGATAEIIAEENLTVSGLGVARRVFEIVDPRVRWQSGVGEGEQIVAGTKLALLRGDARSLLAGERTALNFLQRLCGIATLTSRFAAKVSGLSAMLMDTRKTTPGWRFLEKEAVRHGGGSNHRFSLSDGVLIKDNHVRLAGGIAEAVSRARASVRPGMKIEVEAGTLEEVREAVEAGAEIILVDNNSPESLAAALKVVNGQAVVEVSGGITVENISVMAQPGVSMISVGALTHSARAMDISMDLRPDGEPSE
jgi:nicotinate-nucleotide pyrophosphorylase (carboxylating)